MGNRKLRFLKKAGWITLPAMVAAYLTLVPHTETSLSASKSSAPLQENVDPEVKVLQNIPESENEWKQILTPEQYYILREKGTERPFTGKYNREKREGVFHCGGCGTPLFSSDAKYDSGSGWPSFYTGISNGAIKEIPDNSHGMVRTEIVCARCGGHLGHVFNDGPEPTGLRYCVNSLSLQFTPEQK